MPGVRLPSATRAKASSQRAAAAARRVPETTREKENDVRRLTAILGALAVVVLPLVGLSPADGSQTPTCFRQPATIVGTNGDDTPRGRGDVSDVIYGGGGNDSISGGSAWSVDNPGRAPDLMCGGPGMTTSPGVRATTTNGIGDDTVK